MKLLRSGLDVARSERPSSPLRSCGRLWLGLGALVLSALAPSVAHAQSYDLAPPRSTRLPDARRDAPLVRLGFGIRTQWYGSEGRDPFTTSDLAVQPSLFADATVLRGRHASLAVGASWDFNAVRGDARGISTRLSTHRVLIPVEGRWHWTRWAYGFARVAPGLMVNRASAEGLESGVGPYADTRLAFATDLALGVALAMVPQPKSGARGIRLWAVPELGYGLAGKTSFALQPPETRPDSDVRLPGTTEATRLPGFAGSGPFFRISLVLGF